MAESSSHTLLLQTQVVSMDLVLSLQSPSLHLVPTHASPSPQRLKLQLPRAKPTPSSPPLTLISLSTPNLLIPPFLHLLPPLNPHQPSPPSTLPPLKRLQIIQTHKTPTITMMMTTPPHHPLATNNPAPHSNQSPTPPPYKT